MLKKMFLSFATLKALNLISPRVQLGERKTIDNNHEVVEH